MANKLLTLLVYTRFKNMIRPTLKKRALIWVLERFFKAYARI